MSCLAVLSQEGLCLLTALALGNRTCMAALVHLSPSTGRCSQGPATLGVATHWTRHRGAKVHLPLPALPQGQGGGARVLGPWTAACSQFLPRSCGLQHPGLVPSSVLSQAKALPSTGHLDQHPRCHSSPPHFYVHSDPLRHQSSILPCFAGYFLLLFFFF